MEMFNYYLKLSWRNLVRNRLFFTLMIITLAVGVGVFLANIAIIKSMSQDPLPGKSEKVFNLTHNIWPNDNPSEKLLHVIRYDDAMHFLSNDIATHTMVHYESNVYARASDAKSLTRYSAVVRATTPGFFPITDAPFAYGSAWSNDRAKQVVIGDKLNKSIFGGGNNIGKSIEVDGSFFEVVGILKPWQLKPKFYESSQNNAFSDSDDIYVPLETAMDQEWAVTVRNMSTELITTVSENRGRNGFFLQAYAQLDSKEQQAQMLSFMNNYSQMRKEQGDSLRPSPNRILNVNQWLEENKVVDQQMLAFGLASSLFLAVCIFNASSLLLARYHGARFETGLRRAVGARMKDVFYQGLVESTLIGLCCAVVAIAFSVGFLKLSIALFPPLESTSDINLSLIFIGIAIALVSSFISMLYPLIRSSRQSLSTILK